METTYFQNNEYIALKKERESFSSIFDQQLYPGKTFR